MTRRLGLVTLLLALALALPGPVPAAAPTVTLESQGWWSSPGISVPAQVGAHVHLRATVPADGYPIDGQVAVPVVVTLHAMAGTATSVRVSDGSTVRQTWALTLGPCPTTCTWSGTLTVDFTKWSTGRREMRWTANVPDEQPDRAGKQRMYQSTGWQVCVRSCTPTYRSGPWVEARGWYDDRSTDGTGLAHNYQNARLTSPLTAVRAGGTISISLAPGSGGLTTRLAGAYLDPHFHDGDPGRVLLSRTSAYKGSLVIPTDLTSGPHTLVLLASDGQNAGVLAVPFTTP